MCDLMGYYLRYGIETRKLRNTIVPCLMHVQCNWRACTKKSNRTSEVSSNTSFSKSPSRFGKTIIAVGQLQNFRVNERCADLFLGMQMPREITRSLVERILPELPQEYDIDYSRSCHVELLANIVQIDRTSTDANNSVLTTRQRRCSLVWTFSSHSSTWLSS